MMETVKGHLRERFANTLGGNNSNHGAWLNSTRIIVMLQLKKHFAKLVDGKAPDKLAL
jgi:hypothetical protein